MAGRIPIVVGVSGASGTPYARSVLRGLLAAGVPVDLIVSRAARLTMLDETGVTWHDDEASLDAWLGTPATSAAAPARDPEPGTPATSAAAPARDVMFWGPGDLAAGPSSGSYRTRGMVVVPASTGAVAGIAHGLSKDALQRAADVCLKERRPLVVVVRETPLARPTLVNMLALHDAGAIIAPASPGFYAGAQTAQDLADFLAGKVLDLFDVPHQLARRWSGQIGAARS